MPRTPTCEHCGDSDCSSLDDPPRYCRVSPEAKEAYKEWRRRVPPCEHDDIEDFRCLQCGEWVAPTDVSDFADGSWSGPPMPWWAKGSNYSPNE